MPSLHYISLTGVWHICTDLHPSIHQYSYTNHTYPLINTFPPKPASKKGERP